MNDLNVFYNPDKTFDDNFDNGPYPPHTLPLVDSLDKSNCLFLGYKINSRFGIPAGPLPTSRHIDLALKLGFDVVCYKTQRTVPFPANEFPNIVFLDIDGDLTVEKTKQSIIGSRKINKSPERITITNSFGNPSRGPDFWVRDLKSAVSLQGTGQLVIASVVGTIQQNFTQNDYFNDFAKAAEMAATTGVSVI